MDASPESVRSRCCAAGFDLDVVPAANRAHRRVQRDRHRDRIREPEARVTTLRPRRLHDDAVAIEREARPIVVESANRLDVGPEQIRRTARQLPTHHLERQSRSEDDARRFRVDPDVVLGGRRDVAGGARGTSHDDRTPDPVHEARIALHRERDVGQRPERDQREAGVAADRCENRIDRMRVRWSASGCGIVHVPHAVFTVEPLGVIVVALQRFRGSPMHRHGSPAEFHRETGLGAVAAVSIRRRLRSLGRGPWVRIPPGPPPH